LAGRASARVTARTPALAADEKKEDGERKTNAPSPLTLPALRSARVWTFLPPHSCFFFRAVLWMGRVV
jgi:hypothetical protein